MIEQIFYCFRRLLPSCAVTWCARSTVRRCRILLRSHVAFPNVLDARGRAEMISRDCSSLVYGGGGCRPALRKGRYS